MQAILLNLVHRLLYFSDVWPTLHRAITLPGSVQLINFPYLSALLNVATNRLTMFIVTFTGITALFVPTNGPYRTPTCKNREVTTGILQTLNVNKVIDRSHPSRILPRRTWVVIHGWSYHTAALESLVVFTKILSSVHSVNVTWDEIKTLSNDYSTLLVVCQQDTIVLDTLLRHTQQPDSTIIKINEQERLFCCFILDAMLPGILATCFAAY